MPVTFVTVTERVSVAVRFLTCIREELGSNLVRSTGCGECSSGFPQTLHSNPGIVSRLGSYRFFLKSVFFIICSINTILLSYNPMTTERVVK
jgi:hypothetical protein